jgi:diguanylate cyclase (GGDEF)-like protein/PAS domain S-box-containing protein
MDRSGDRHLDNAVAGGLAPGSGTHHAPQGGPAPATTADLWAAYQPIVDLRDGRVLAVEALIRGTRAGVSVSPAELFAEAGRAGPAAVLRLDEACMRCVLASASGLPAGATLFVNLEPATMASLSPESLRQMAALVPPEVRVVVEVTERDLLRHPAAMLAGVQRVRDLGWRIAVDDVGAEPAALALMPFLRPDVIKLDLALVQSHPTLDVAAIVNAVHAEAQRSGAVVLAEGVETPEHQRRAVGLGATLGQGWHFGRPGPLPQHWDATLPLRAAPVPPPTGTSAFDVIGRGVPAQLTTPAQLGPLTRQLERQAMLLDDMTVVLASFQHADFLTPATLRRYATLAKIAALTAILGPAMPAEPAPGVRGTALHDDDPLSQEWVVSVVSPHFAAALAAREVTVDPAGGDAEPAQRRMEYVLTYDRARVVAAAGLLMVKVQPQVLPRRRPTPDRTPQTPDRQRDLAGSVPGVPQAELPALLTRAISTATNGIAIADARAPDMPLVYVNAAFEHMTGYTRDQVVGRNCRLLQGPATDPATVKTIARRLLAGREVQVTLLNHRRDGTPFWNEITISPVFDDQRVLTHFIGNQVDVSDRVDREQRTTYLAHHDPLTGLPNRARVLDHLQLELLRSARSGAAVAVVFIDLNDFKNINDAHGHAAGDQALIGAAQRLRSVVRSGDMLARLGGDEFLLVLAGLTADDEPVRHVVEHLHTALAPPLDVAGSTLHLSAGIGYALSPHDGTDAAALIDTADARMYRTKKAS